MPARVIFAFGEMALYCLFLVISEIYVYRQADYHMAAVASDEVDEQAEAALWYNRIVPQPMAKK